MKKISLSIVLTSMFIASIDRVHAYVSLNEKGIGQVLIYPYYTVNNNMNTLISLTNTSDKVKAVKIKFLEGKNNRDTLIFSIYIPPFDEWTGALVTQTSTIPNHVGEPSVKLITNDTTCTVPTGINGQEFLPYAYEGDFDDGFGTDLSRGTEGQIQVFEMGNVVGEYANWAIHSTQDCNKIQNNWAAEGAWIVDPTENIDAPNGSGGLFGSVHLIDVNGGIDVSYNADAIQGYSTEIQHELPGTSLPNLNSGNSKMSMILSPSLPLLVPWEFPFQAVSSLFIMKNIYAEYIVDNGIGANTEMVVSFPTKEFFTDSSKSPSQVPVAPFTSENGECEAAELLAYNRETSNSTNSIEFCLAVNTVEFISAASTNEPSTILGSKNTMKINTSFDKGWASFIFDQEVSTTDTSQTFGSTYTFKGLPIAGFTIQRFVNASLNGGILANYAGLVKHKGANEIIVLVP